MLLGSLERDEILQVNKYCTDALYNGNNLGAPCEACTVLGKQRQKSFSSSCERGWPAGTWQEHPGGAAIDCADLVGFSIIIENTNAIRAHSAPMQPHKGHT